MAQLKGDGSGSFWFEYQYHHKTYKSHTFRTFADGREELRRLSRDGKIPGELVSLFRKLREKAGLYVPWWKQQPTSSERIRVAHG
jgi:hypothetical protein